MKKISLLLIGLLCLSQSYAQWGTLWSKSYQHTSNTGYSNEARFVVTDANGNVFTLADVTSNLDATNHPTPTTHYFVWLKKFDFNGTLLGDRIIEVNNMQSSGTDFKSAFSLQIDGLGNTYIGYSTYNSGSYDIAVVKYSNQLVQQWQKTYTAPGDQSGVDMIIFSGVAHLAFKSVYGVNTTYSLIKLDNTAGIVTPFYNFDANLDVVNAITMNSSKTIFATGYRTVGSAKSMMTANIGVGGALKWKTLFNNNTPTGDDIGNDVVIGSDGNIFVVGTTFTNATNGNDGIVVRHLVGTGVAQGTITLDLGTTTDNGGLIANGATGFIYASACNNTKAIVSKIALSPFGTSGTATYLPLPVNAYTSISKVTINDMKVAPTTFSVYLTGGVQAVSAAGNFSASYLVKTGQNGFLFKVLNSQSVVGDFNNNFTGMSVALDPTHNNNILWLRSQWNPFGLHTSESIHIDGLVSGGPLRIASSEEGISNEEKITLYPNPVNDQLFIDSNLEIGSVEIYNAIGKLVKAVDGYQSSGLNVSELGKGVYFVKITTDQNQITKKILVQ